ncbi:hypothetical protein T440DRAFT_522485 [Plenodomus tracheiphilus IPT5]|uniref:Uncharacterized protein n=1 Tax=Plenodomus tracheiphilus IPT5 TaxID=1408161 RepID=A0A6A7ATP0_9PLEO|nr:hypothetical protein T440DRAFT_522485 [Plenodomus tracheiphilus IPT5]
MPKLPVLKTTANHNTTFNSYLICSTLVLQSKVLNVLVIAGVLFTLSLASLAFLKLSLKKSFYINYKATAMFNLPLKSKMILNQRGVHRVDEAMEKSVANGQRYDTDSD